MFIDSRSRCFVVASDGGPSIASYYAHAACIRSLVKAFPHCLESWLEAIAYRSVASLCLPTLPAIANLSFQALPRNVRTLHCTSTR